MSIRYVLFCLSFLIITSCGSKKKVVKNNPKKEVVIIEKKPTKLPSVNETKHVEKLKESNLNKYTLDYIERFAPIAVSKMQNYKIPASITLAQGILESGNGRSELALKSNNHFGIKCHTNWTGETVRHDDDEKKECFRKYKHPESSYDDHSAFLTQRKRYAFLFSFGSTDYKKWAYGLKDAGYATDKKYPQKLIKIIEDYKLYEFDKLKKKNSTNKNNITQKKFYEVKKGDTLYSISKRFTTSVEKLKQINRLKDNTISIGQKLIIQ